MVQITHNGEFEEGDVHKGEFEKEGTKVLIGSLGRCKLALFYIVKTASGRNIYYLSLINM